MSILLGVLGDSRVPFESTGDGIEGDGDAVEREAGQLPLGDDGKSSKCSLVLLEELHNAPDADS